MSVIENSKYGWFISHQQFIEDAYKLVDSSSSYRFKKELFAINSPYKEAKQQKQSVKLDPETSDDFEKEVQHVQEKYTLFRNDLQYFDTNMETQPNSGAIQTATAVYNTSGEHLIEDAFGSNIAPASTKILNESKFLFPDNCNFYCKDVSDFSKHIQESFDLILMDPPWWNKYIRRKRKHSEHGYSMMYNEDLKNLPLESHLNPDGLLVVWCTNSPPHLDALINQLFPKWGIEYIGKWYWIKVTTKGEPICPFSKPPRKQPFEQIIIGRHKSRKLENPPVDQLLISVPSAIHSHKPPLNDVLKNFLPENPSCLEIFARYLLPNWSSYGKEALKLQHECLYEEGNLIN